MKIAIVNDVQAIRTILSRVIAEHTHHQIVWTAGDGQEALERCQNERPDLILMDLLMPVMGGVEATRRIMDTCPCAILVVTASVGRNASAVFEAMGAGALDAISTPTVEPSRAGGGAGDLVRKISTIEKLITKRPAPVAGESSIEQKPIEPGLPLIAIGCSTGGPAAVAAILRELPADLPAGLVVVQHVDREFVASLAQWLNGQTPLQVGVAHRGDRPAPGQVLVAGAEEHLVVTSSESLGYTAEPREYPYRPSVNIFFESAAAHWRSAVIGVLLTGMGRDGAEGLLRLRRRGMFTIAQDQDSCAVYGMPKAAAKLDAACRVLPLDTIATALIERVKHLDPDNLGGATP